MACAPVWRDTRLLRGREQHERVKPGKLFTAKQYQLRRFRYLPTKKLSVSAGCQIRLAAGTCEVPAIGRCGRCGLAFCLTHQAIEGALEYRNLCQVCLDTAKAAEAKRNSQPSPYTRAVAEAARRRAAAVRALKDIGSPGLVPRRVRVGTTGKRFGKDIEHYDLYQPAWPVGDCLWTAPETRYSGGGQVPTPSGVTPADELVPMLTSHRWEPPMERANPPYRTGGGSLLDRTEQTVEIYQMIADSLEDLMRVHSHT